MWLQAAGARGVSMVAAANIMKYIPRSLEDNREEELLVLLQRDFEDSNA